MAACPDERGLIKLQNTDTPSRIKVSSVLNRDVKQFGKKYMFDDNEETCWNSDQGSPQFVTMELPSVVTVSSVHIRFQGGFACTHCVLSTTDNESVCHFYPKDSNSLQIFPVSLLSPSNSYKLEFRDSTDFYGRITVYHLQLYGQN